MRWVLIGGIRRTAAAFAAPAILRHTRAYAATPILRIGQVSPRTGPMAGFAEADDYVLEAIQQVFNAGLENNGKNWKLEILFKDS